MDSLKTSGGKKRLKAVKREEKKHSDFMSVLRREEAKKRLENQKARIKAATATPSEETTTAVAAIASKTTKAKKSSSSKRSEKLAAIAKVAETRPDIVKSSFCAPDPTPEQLAPLGPRTTDDELNALFEEIGREADMDPEMTQDLLDFLNSDEDEEEYEEEYMDVDVTEEALAMDESPVDLTHVEEPQQEEEVEEEEDQEAKEEAERQRLEDEKKRQKDKEMEEMLAMIDAAKDDVANVTEEDLMALMKSPEPEEQKVISDFAFKLLQLWKGGH